MLTQSQQKKMNRIGEDVVDLLKSNTSSSSVLQKTIKDVTGPFMDYSMSGKPPSLQVLQLVATNLLAVVLASTPDEKIN